MERPEFHGVLDRRIPRRNADCEVLADVFDPAALADGSESQCNRFVERFRCDFGAVLNTLSIADRDAA